MLKKVKDFGVIFGASRKGMLEKQSLKDNKNELGNDKSCQERVVIRVEKVRKQ